MFKLFLVLMMISYLFLSSLFSLVDHGDTNEAVYGLVASMVMFIMVGGIASQKETVQ